MRIDLHIAGYRIRLTEAQDYPAISWPLHPFGSFLDCSEHHPDIDLAITVIEELPTLSHGPLRFDAARASGACTMLMQDGFWSLWIPRPASLVLARSSPKTFPMWICGPFGKRLRRGRAGFP